MAKIKLGDRVELVDDELDLKAGHKGLVVGAMYDNVSLVLFDDYHNGHDGGSYEDEITYLKGYSYKRLCKIDGGCKWIQDYRLKVLPTLKSWKGGKR